VLESTHPLEAQYAVPLGYRIRTLWTLNLRELFHVIELRSARQGHTSYRRIAQALYRTAIAVHPWLKDLIRVDLNDYALARGLG
jgi:thymidylate synthase ThyX